MFFLFTIEFFFVAFFLSPSFYGWPFSGPFSASYPQTVAGVVLGIAVPGSAGDLF